QTLKGYMDYYFRPKYEEVKGLTAQVDSIWESLEKIYPAIKSPTVQQIPAGSENSMVPNNQFSTEMRYHICWKKIYRDIDHNLKIPNKKELILDLNSIEQYYIDLFGIPFTLNIQHVKNELYTFGIHLPCRKFNIEIDTITACIIDELKERWPHPKGIFTKHLGTLQMADKANESFNQLDNILSDSQLMSPEEYLEGDTAIPSVSHVFIKDEVLKRSKVELEEKIQAIIAQDPLNYFYCMLVNSRQNKRMDPMSVCAIGISATHTIPPQILRSIELLKSICSLTSLLWIQRCLKYIKMLIEFVCGVMKSSAKR
ncbi:20938_t:CDS:2, partial [Gigaspora rosea]